MPQATENGWGKKTSLEERKVQSHYDFYTSSKSLSSLLLDLMPGTKFPQICVLSGILVLMEKMLRKNLPKNENKIPTF